MDASFFGADKGYLPFLARKNSRQGVVAPIYFEFLFISTHGRSSREPILIYVSTYFPSSAPTKNAPQKGCISLCKITNFDTISKWEQTAIQLLTIFRIIIQYLNISLDQRVSRFPKLQNVNGGRLYIHPHTLLQRWR